jgi:hypothetical protein
MKKIIAALAIAFGVGMVAQPAVAENSIVKFFNQAVDAIMGEQETAQNDMPASDQASETAEQATADAQNTGQVGEGQAELATAAAENESARTPETMDEAVEQAQQDAENLGEKTQELAEDAVEQTEQMANDVTNQGQQADQVEPAAGQESQASPADSPEANTKE